ncbi:MAG: hypothetical protein NVS9B7_28890 [Flavisolibacter sp.]
MFELKNIPSTQNKLSKQIQKDFVSPKNSNKSAYTSRAGPNKALTKKNFIKIVLRLLNAPFV